MRAAFICILAVAGLLAPSGVEACSCAGSVSSLTAFKRADLVFVGTVVRSVAVESSSRVNADGSITVSGGTVPPITTFNVAHVFRGGSVPEIVVTGGGSTCDEPFAAGEMWLVYAQARDGHITTDKCTRTSLSSEAAPDLVYLEGLEHGRRQGVVYGNVHRLMAGADKRLALQVLFEPLQVVAVGDGQRVQITTQRSGAFQLVLPPGDFEIWVERAGRAVSPKQMVRVDHDSERELQLQAAYED